MKAKYIDNIEQYNQLIEKNYSTREIAKELGVSTSLIKHRFIKLGLRTKRYKEPKEPLSKELLEKLIAERLSSYRIAEKINRSQSTVRYWLKYYGLKTDALYKSYTRSPAGIKESKICSKCGIVKKINSDNFYISSKGIIHSWCKDCNNTITYQKQVDRKRKALDFLGGKCVMCGYDKCSAALHFHHLDPAKKDFNISKLRTYSFEVLKKELVKCCILCANCHAETHIALHISKLVPRG
jgi:predicted transcriptional regulator